MKNRERAQIELSSHNDSGLVSKRQTGTYIYNGKFFASALPLVENLFRTRVSNKVFLRPIEMLIRPVPKFNEIVCSIDSAEHVCFGFGAVQILHYVQIIFLKVNPEGVEYEWNGNYDDYCDTNQNFGSRSQPSEAIHLN